MILSYRDNRTKAFAEGRVVREFHGFARQAYRRLEILDAATGLDELKALRSNRLENAEGRSRRPIQHTRQHAMAHLLRVAAGGGRTRQRRNRRLSLRSHDDEASDPSRGDPRRRACRAGTDADRACAPTQRAGEPDYADHPRQAIDHRRYRAAPGTLVRYQRPALAQPAKRSRRSRRRAAGGGRDRAPAHALRTRKPPSAERTA